MFLGLHARRPSFDFAGGAWTSWSDPRDYWRERLATTQALRVGLRVLADEAAAFEAAIPSG